ncbi:unnamed protein product [Soboliphyme baturini]|uniref:HTH psq-type domain-containing protein n=1 Tax=Soboliphyme baturini TaxID=241478 RepID=A0A183J0G0_9BILA|nr:unnamed protein product [Soboliphyme baturini]
MDDFEYETILPRPTTYYTSREKQLIADYVSRYGASSAAARFNIPSTQAYYVYRRQFRRTSTRNNGYGVYSASCSYRPDSNDGSRSIDANLLINDDELERKLTGYVTSVIDFDQSSIVKTEEHVSDEDTKLKIDIKPQINPIVFKKRRPARGRPKLLGDEIDYKLMVTLLKIKEDGIQITPSIVAFVVRKLLSTHRRGLLKEEGGEFESSASEFSSLYHGVHDELRLCGRHHSRRIRPIVALTPMVARRGSDFGLRRAARQSDRIRGVVHKSAPNESCSGLMRTGGNQLTGRRLTEAIAFDVVECKNDRSFVFSPGSVSIL